MEKPFPKKDNRVEGIQREGLAVAGRGEEDCGYALDPWP